MITGEMRNEVFYKEREGLMSAATKAAKKTLRLTQLKSTIGFRSDQAKTIRALGLGKIGATVEQVDNPAVRGMIFKVKHLIEVEEI
jgi:large subunit ribosomal protein L30